MKAISKKLRARAKKHLATTRREVAQMPVEAVQKLVQKLQFHQIELETQNDELRRTQLELEAARERLRLAYDAAPVGFLTLDAQGVIGSANLAVARLLNFDRVKLPGQKLTRFIVPGSQDAFYRHCQQLLNTGEKQTCEIDFLRKGGGQFTGWLESVAERADAGQSPHCLVMVSDITARKHAELRLAAFAEATFEGILESEAGRITDCNDQMARMIGCTVAELIGTEIAAMVVPEDRDRVMAKIRAGLEQEIEHELLRRDGTRIFVEARGQPVFLGSGRRHTAIRDITQRKRAAEVHAKLAALVETSEDAIISKDLDGTVTSWNAAAERLFGFRGEEIIGQPILRIIPSELQAEEVAILNRLRQGESVSHYETVRLAKNGQRIPVSLTISPIRDAAGVILGVSKIARDITGRKQAEEALWQARNELEVRVCERTAELTCANAALRAEKAFSDSLIELAPAIIAVVNAQGHLVRTNAYAEQLGGYPFAETEGRNMISLFLPKDDQSRMRHVLREALQGRAAQGVVAPFRTRAGKIRHIEWFSKPLASTDGKTATVLAIGHDITDRIKLEEEILHISERERRVIAQDLHDGLGQLLVGTLHLAHTLQKDLAAGSPAKARRLSRIKDIINEAVTQTRDLARGLHPVESVPNGLMAALETLSTRTKKLFQVTCHFNGRRTVLIHDDAIATHLFRIAQEAVTNAIKHASPKHIEISLGETPGRIRLAVKNDGLNLAESPRKPTGMGLRIMHYRARMIGGFLTIQKKAGGGTIIVCTVHVPAKRSEISVRNAPPKKQ